MDSDKTVEARLRRLERANRALMAGLAIAIGLPALLGAWQAPKPVKELRAERLAIVDAKGVERITLEGDETTSGLFFPSPDGKRTLASLDVTNEEVGLALNGPAHQVVLAAGREGGSIALTDLIRGKDAEKPKLVFRAVLEADRDVTRLRLNDPKDRPLFQAPK